MSEGTPNTPLDEFVHLRFQIANAFSPAAPIDRADLFAGRTNQMTDLVSVIAQRGQHAIIYGERGVGKTSLTTVIADVLSQATLVPLRTNCDGTDDFSSVWRKVLREATFAETVPGTGFKPADQSIMHSAAELIPDDRPVTPDDVRRALSALGQQKITVVIIDEFDRLSHRSSTTLFADTIKLLSDRLSPVTLVLVGVADSVDELIAEHRSVERALVQIHMPRMSRSELAEIIDRGLGKVGMSIDEDAVNRITQLSQGLPHYTHLIAQGAAQAAADLKSRHVDLEDVRASVTRALDRAQESIKEAYFRATSIPRRNLYTQVLLACALAKEDDLGFFAAADVREPLSIIMGKPYDIPAFGLHLNALTNERGPVLQKKGAPRNFRYRFINPLLEPYVIMRGLASGMISETALL